MIYIADLARWEGRVDHMYRDSAGFVTCGIGSLLKTPRAAEALPWRNTLTDEPADSDEIGANYAVVSTAPPGHAAEYYEQFTRIRLVPGAAENITEQRLESEFLPGLRRQFQSFDQYPETARRALVDLAWNVGLFGLASFMNLHSACETADWERASRSCHVVGVRPERHTWRVSMLSAAGRVA